MPFGAWVPDRLTGELAAMVKHRAPKRLKINEPDLTLSRTDSLAGVGENITARRIMA